MCGSLLATQHSNDPGHQLGIDPLAAWTAAQGQLRAVAIYDECRYDFRFRPAPDNIS